MRNIENLGLTAMEECVELAEALSKTMRFGVDGYVPGTYRTTNGQLVMQEFYHVQAMIEKLQEIGYLPILDESEISHIKQSKLNNVKTYQQISIERGLCDKVD